MPKARRNLATFAASHNDDVKIPNKIRAALEQMRKEDGEEAYAYEATDPEGTPFIKRAGISGVQLSQYRDQFAEHVVQVKQDTGSRRGPRWVWFATAKAAKKARGE